MSMKYVVSSSRSNSDGFLESTKGSQPRQLVKDREGPRTLSLVTGVKSMHKWGRLCDWNGAMPIPKVNSLLVRSFDVMTAFINQQSTIFIKIQWWYQLRILACARLITGDG